MPKLVLIFAYALIFDSQFILSIENLSICDFRLSAAIFLLFFDGILLLADQLWSSQAFYTYLFIHNLLLLFYPVPVSHIVAELLSEGYYHLLSLSILCMR